MNRFPRILLCAGEASGDRLAAELVAALRARRQDLQFRGIAGPAMRRVGVEPIARAEELEVMGFTAVVPKLPAVLRSLVRTTDAMDSWRPDVVVTVDSPDSMLKLTRAARRRGIPAVHWVSPQVWAWRRGRVKSIATAVDCMLCLFPIEPPLYEEEGLTAVFTGHPVVARMGGAEPMARRGEEVVVALVPGSRRTEIGELWPVMSTVAALLRQRLGACRFVVPVAPTVDPAWLSGLDVELVGDLSEVAGADVAICCSGTATLELCVLGVPMVVLYRANRLNWAIGSRMVDLDHIALPNILAGRRVAPEHLQVLDPVAIADDAVAQLGEVGDAQRVALAEVAAGLGTGDAAGVAADEVLRWVG